MLVYAGYVVVFPLAFGVPSAIGDVRVAERSFKAKRENLGRVLGEARVADLIAGRPRAARQRFRFWATLVAAIYLVAAVAATVAGYTIPDAIDSSPPSSTVPTTVPGSSPVPR